MHILYVYHTDLASNIYLHMQNRPSKSTQYAIKSVKIIKNKA